MSKFLLFFQSVAVLMCFLFANGVAAQGVKISEYGIYDDNQKLIRKSKVVPAGQVVRFGFCFEAFVNFFDDDKYMLTQSLVHPEILSDEGWPNKGYNVPRKFKVENGTAFGCVGYNARSKKEAPAGEWVFSLSDGSDELLKFTFSLK